MFWGPSFSRNLNEREFSQFLSMMELLNDVFIPIDGLDKRVWAASSNDQFSVFSLYSTLVLALTSSPLAKIWRLHTRWA